MVSCFLCLITLSKKCASFSILKSHGTHSKTKYSELIGKLLDDQNLVITVSNDNFVCETCNTLINAFDRHIYEQNVIKQIISRQVGSSYLENKRISLTIDQEALATFDKHLDVFQCRQCVSFKTSKIEFVAAHFKAHQCKLNEARPIVKNEINDDDDDDQEMQIEEILLNPTCKYEDDDSEFATSSSDLYVTVGENSVSHYESPGNKERRKRRIQRAPNPSAMPSPINSTLPKYFKEIVKITKTHGVDTNAPCKVENLFEIEVPQVESAGICFPCRICVRKFLHPLKLASHLLTHKDIKYNCNHCPFTVSDFNERARRK